MRAGSNQSISIRRAYIPAVLRWSRFVGGDRALPDSIRRGALLRRQCVLWVGHRRATTGPDRPISEGMTPCPVDERCSRTLTFTIKLDMSTSAANPVTRLGAAVGETRNSSKLEQAQFAHQAHVSPDSLLNSKPGTHVWGWERRLPCLMHWE